jgi:hypothetical protein
MNCRELAKRARDLNLRNSNRPSVAFGVGITMRDECTVFNIMRIQRGSPVAAKFRCPLLAKFKCPL